VTLESNVTMTNLGDMTCGGPWELGAVDDTFLPAISSRTHSCTVGFSFGEMSAEAEERMGVSGLLE
jgi:hypothetical protein